MGDEHRLGLLDRGERSAVDRSARSIARINCRAARADCSPTDAGMRIAATIVFQTNGTTPRTSSPGRSGSGEGYAALVLDSFGGRSIRRRCGDPSPLRGQRRSPDVYAAAAYLATLPVIDRTRIDAMGWSHG